MKQYLKKLGVIWLNIKPKMHEANYFDGRKQEPKTILNSKHPSLLPIYVRRKDKESW